MKFSPDVDQRIKNAASFYLYSLMCEVHILFLLAKNLLISSKY
ncbi:hypothetical protein RC62_4118 [Flavobacterium aquidurense]|uniref:Uncharacterized protein n=1 Tax=Flavobacterium aquidurense TaxID=362413 RepID=A0A0N8VN79_9FLAO|nr:hypothetical protein RC62_4118 [Flavobacterium aquidurense]